MSDCVNTAIEAHLRFYGIEPDTKVIYQKIKELATPRHPNLIAREKEDDEWNNWTREGWDTSGKTWIPYNYSQINELCGPFYAANLHYPPVEGEYAGISLDGAELYWGLHTSWNWNYTELEDKWVVVEKGTRLLPFTDAELRQQRAEYLEERKQWNKYLSDEWSEQRDGKFELPKNNAPLARISSGLDYTYTYDGIVPHIYWAIAPMYGLVPVIEHRLWTPDSYIQQSQTDHQRNLCIVGKKLGYYGKEVMQITIQPAIYLRLHPAHAHFALTPPPEGMGCVMGIQLVPVEHYLVDERSADESWKQKMEAFLEREKPLPTRT